MRTAPPEERAGQYECDGHDLHQRDRSVKHQRAIGIAADELNRAALESVQKKIGAEKLPLKGLPPADPDENQKIAELGGGFVQLRRVKRNAHRRADKARGNGICERDAPGQSGRFAIAASRSKTTQAANSVTERQSCRERVHHREQRHFLKIRI